MDKEGETREFRIRIGDPKSDGDFLIYGFGRSTVFEDWPCRWTSAKAALKLPIPPRSISNLTLTVNSEILQEVKVFLGEVCIGEFQVSAGKWSDFTTELSSTPIEKEEVSMVYILNSRHHHLTWWEPGCLAMADLRVKVKSNLTLSRTLKKGARRAKTYEEVYAETYRKLGRGIEGFNLCWGDLHIHTNLSHCDHPYSGSPEENLEYARDKANLDFASLTDHAEDMTEKQWKKINSLSRQYNKQGVFITVPAFEWTSDFYGHKNVYYAKEDLPHFPSTRPQSDSPSDLWQRIKETGEEAIVIPHHPSKKMFLQNWDFHNPQLEPCLEIYSKWGSFEYYGNSLQSDNLRYSTFPGLFAQDVLMRGYRLGFVGGSDGHVLAPGSRGLTAVFVRELSRKAIFEAIRTRRVYATTGARIELCFTLNGHPMGEELVVNQYQLEKLYPLEIYVEVVGTSSVDRVEVLENNQLIYREKTAPAGGYFAVRFSKRGIKEPLANRHINFLYEIEASTKFYYSRFYYVRVIQTDKHVAWSSPIWITLKSNEPDDKFPD